MKKIKFLHGIGAMCAFAIVALVGSSLLTSCEKEDLDATFETEPAKAIIAVSAVDAETGSSVTPTKIESNVGTVSGSEIIVTGEKGKDLEQTVNVTVVCNGLTGTGSVKVAVKNGSVGHYSITFLVGKEIIYVPVPGEQDAAKAVVTASAVDAKTGEALEGVTFTFESTVEGGVAEGNVFTIIGNKDIKAQKVTVKALKTDEVLAESVVEIPDIKEGSFRSYSILFKISTGTGGPVGPVDPVETVSYETIVSEPEKGEAEKYYLTGNYTHTYGGIDQWSLNDSEYLLDVTVSYEAYMGYEIQDKKIIETSDYVDALMMGFENGNGIQKYMKTETFKVSAWSAYAAWVVVTPFTTKYEVKKIVNENKEEATVVASFSLLTKNVEFAHTEIAHPDHTHDYVFGHGHGHGHGHGNGNAGGGIALPD